MDREGGEKRKKWNLNAKVVRRMENERKETRMNGECDQEAKFHKDKDGVVEDHFQG